MKATEWQGTSDKGRSPVTSVGHPITRSALELAQICATRCQDLNKRLLVVRLIGWWVHVPSIVPKFAFLSPFFQLLTRKEAKTTTGRDTSSPIATTWR